LFATTLYRPLLDHDLVLYHRYRDLVLADPGPGILLVDRHPLYADLLVPGRHSYLLAVGSHLLINPNLTGFALARTGPKLFFAALHPKLILCSIGNIRRIP